jgi:hypothetical protein
MVTQEVNDAILPERRSALERQLTELNGRGRWYSGQLWQVPFAYLTITGVAIGGTADKVAVRQSFVLCSCAVFGICVFIHLCGMIDGQARAVRSIQAVEALLKLEQTAKLRYWYAVPLVAAVALATVVYIVGAFQVW